MAISVTFCSHCGEKISDDANFCPKCGFRTEHGLEAGVFVPTEDLREAFSKMGVELEKALQKAAQEIQKAVQNVRIEVVDSRKGLSVVCKSCGEKNSFGSVYCTKCGHKLD